MLNERSVCRQSGLLREGPPRVRFPDWTACLEVEKWGPTSQNISHVNFDLKPPQLLTLGCSYGQVIALFAKRYQGSPSPLHP